MPFFSRVFAGSCARVNPRSNQRTCITAQLPDLATRTRTQAFIDEHDRLEVYRPELLGQEPDPAPPLLYSETAAYEETLYFQALKDAELEYEKVWDYLPGYGQTRYQTNRVNFTKTNRTIVVYAVRVGMDYKNGATGQKPWELRDALIRNLASVEFEWKIGTAEMKEGADPTNPEELWSTVRERFVRDYGSEPLLKAHFPRYYDLTQGIEFDGTRIEPLEATPAARRLFDDSVVIDALIGAPQHLSKEIEARIVHNVDGFLSYRIAPSKKIPSRPRSSRRGVTVTGSCPNHATQRVRYCHSPHLIASGC